MSVVRETKRPITAWM